MHETSIRSKCDEDEFVVAPKRKTGGKQPPAKRARVLDKMVQVVAQPSGIEFEIHEGLLKKKSSYFKAVLESNFKESHERIIDLDDTSPEILELFQNWLYFEDSLKYDGRTITKERWCDLYVFADMRGIPGLQNYIINIFAAIDWWKWSVHPIKDDIQYVYSHTADKSPLRRLIMDLFRSKLAVDGFFTRCGARFDTAATMKNQDLDGVSVKVLHDVIRALLSEKPDTGRDIHKGRCIYHIHSKEEERCPPPA